MLTSDPSEASVLVDGVPKGGTPLEIKMLRRKSHTIQFDSDGYRPCEKAVVTHATGWIFGNILFGGLIGLIVDLCTGANNELEPSAVHCDLDPVDEEVS